MSTGTKGVTTGTKDVSTGTKDLTTGTWVQSGAVRWGTFLLILLLVGILTAVFVVRAVQQQNRALRPTAATRLDQGLDLAGVLGAPHVVFRSTAPGPTFGKLAAVPLAEPEGKRAVSTQSCDRVFATTGAGVCLSVERGAVLTYHAELLDAGMQQARELPLGGVPSRARLSPDGSLVGSTAFVSGHSYASMGFSTETTIVNRVTGEDYGNLEKTFTMKIDPRRNHAADLNVWGTTFSPGPDPAVFYATVAAGGLTWVARGDLKARTLTAVHTDAECPSLSPDGRLLVYKKRAGSPIRWRYHALDLKTGQEWPLPETRSVDDQVEWLDNSHVLYAVPRGTDQRSDIWVTSIRDGRPRVFLPDASSPAVVR